MKTLCVDFDGVIHAYTSGWKGADRADDGPVPGAMKFLVDAVEKFDEVCVYSSRSLNHKGVYVMQRAISVWLQQDVGMATDDADTFVYDKLKFPTQKPPAFVTLDDRCVCFEGSFPSIESLLNFTPWNKKVTAAPKTAS